MSAIEHFLRKNAEYADTFSAKKLPVPPAKQIAIVTCMDARLNLRDLLGLETGDAHVIRNAGGILTDDVIRSLTLSQRLLGTREIMLIQHTGCGMLTFTDAELNEALHKETNVQPPFEFGAFRDLEESVRHSIDRIKASPFVPHRDEVRGFVYEIETGRLREVR